MKNYLILLLSVCGFNASAVESLGPSFTNQADEVCDVNDIPDLSENLEQVLNQTAALETMWMNQLSLQLLEHDDVNIQMLAVSHLSASATKPSDLIGGGPLTYQEQFKAVFEWALESSSVSVPTLLMARSVCDDLASTELCHVNQLTEKLIAVDANNMSVYFNDLQQAVYDSDEEQVNLILQQMSQAHYSRFLNPLSSELMAAIDQFQVTQPFSKLLDNELLDLMAEYMPNIDLDEMMKQNIWQMYHINNYLHMTALRPLMVACEKFQQDGQWCQLIADTLVSSSDNALMTQIGYALDEKLNEWYGDKKSLEVSQAVFQSYRDYQACLLKNHQLMDDRSYLSDKGFAQIMLQGNHELRNFELAAIYLFDKYKSCKPEQAVDPKTCGLRYIDID